VIEIYFQIVGWSLMLFGVYVLLFPYFPAFDIVRRHVRKNVFCQYLGLENEWRDLGRRGQMRLIAREIGHALSTQEFRSSIRDGFGFTEALILAAGVVTPILLIMFLVIDHIAV